MTTTATRTPNMETRRLALAPGSALDPLVEEVTWVAWRLESASAIPSDTTVRATATAFNRIVEAAWLPGRMTVFRDRAGRACRTAPAWRPGRVRRGGPPLGCQSGEA